MKKTILTLLVLALLAGPTAMAGEFYTKHKKADKRFGEPTEDQALVYVVRGAKMGGAIRTWAFHDEELIGVTRASGYAFALVPPGERLIWSKAENTSALRVNLEAGRTYYFKQKILPGIGKARVKLMPIDEAEATKIMRKCGWCEATAAGRERGAEIAANRIERAAKQAGKSGG